MPKQFSHNARQIGTKMLEIRQLVSPECVQSHRRWGCLISSGSFLTRTTSCRLSARHYSHPLSGQPSSLALRRDGRTDSVEDEMRPSQALWLTPLFVDPGSLRVEQEYESECKQSMNNVVLPCAMLHTCAVRVGSILCCACLLLPQECVHQVSCCSCQ